ncbi:hypothetical protein GQR58_000037 [Nymphon striatum]|nr:hypothetical protein GQR58_000037 [Nymphon striatum]
MKQCVIHRLAALTGRLDKNAQIGARLGLSDKIAQHLRTQSAVHIFRQRIRAQRGIGLVHPAHPLGANSFRARRIKPAVSASGASPDTCATALAASAGAYPRLPSADNASACADALFGATGAATLGAATGSITASSWVGAATLCPPIAITLAALSFSSFTTRSAVLGPTPLAALTEFTSPNAMARPTPSGPKAPRIASECLCADALNAHQQPVPFLFHQRRKPEQLQQILAHQQVRI